MARLGLGIDVGGTFTDIVAYDPSTGRQVSHKQLTTHDDPAEGVLAGLDRLLADNDITAPSIARVVHATTLFSNAVIERKGALTGLITTTGFRDVLEIGRERKFELYDINITKPKPLVPRHLRAEIEERLGPDGMVRTPLNEESVLRAVATLRTEGVISLAVALLHAYANPDHERRVVDLVARVHPELAISASVDVAPEIREYERVSTTVINAYVKPLAERYLSALADRLAARGIAAPLLLMLSNGGLTNIEDAKRNPVRMLESGPAAGALVAAHIGSALGRDHVLAFDMGGTTAKLSVIDDGKPAIAYSFEVARERRFSEGSGLPVRISTVELIEIGAGGGSIARLDEIGLLKVGPESAGSEPGPASYGRGGVLPTVTDADLVLGFLNPAYFVGGAMPIDVRAAEAALRPLADAAGLGVTALAWGIHDVVNENMANAARVHIAEHGKDPRRYTLLATGGAGPVHAYRVAQKLGLRQLIAPVSAGVASALGLLVAPARVDRVTTVACEIGDIVWPELESTFARLEADAMRLLAVTLPGAPASIERLADIRYVGQASELVVKLPPGPYTAQSRRALMEAFEASYIAAFTRTPPAPRVEVINVRITARAEVARGLAPSGEVRPRSVPAIKGRRAVHFPEYGEHRPTAVYDRYALTSGQAFDGPAVVEERESTLVVGPGGRFEVQASGDIVVTIG